MSIPKSIINQFILFNRFVVWTVFCTLLKWIYSLDNSTYFNFIARERKKRIFKRRRGRRNSGIKIAIHREVIAGTGQLGRKLWSSIGFFQNSLTESFEKPPGKPHKKPTNPSNLTHGYLITCWKFVPNTN